MGSNDKHVKLQLIKTIDSIKEKYKVLQQQSANLDDSLNVKYKPILTAMNNITSNKSDINSIQNVSSGINSNGIENTSNTLQNGEKQEVTDDSSEWNSGELSRSMNVSTLNAYLQLLGTNKHDQKYGIYKKRNGKYYIGDTDIALTHNNITIRGESFPLTQGLLNLLFLKLPARYKKSDKARYKEILMLANLHNLRNVRNESFKYVKIIAPMLQEKAGKSLQTNFMEVNRESKIDYKYWDNPNELVDRLRLLIASQSAGHSGHNNEIIEIIEELREANIIE